MVGEHSQQVGEARGTGLCQLFTGLPINLDETCGQLRLLRRIGRQQEQRGGVGARTGVLLALLHQGTQFA
ncbi:hypothetical protein D3C86_2072870 [compost metagenome]